MPDEEGNERMSVRNEIGEIIPPESPDKKVALEDLIDSKQKEILDLKASMPDLLLAESLAIEEGEKEQNVFYDKKTKRLSFVKVSEELKDDNKVRIGTIGHIDLATIPGIVIHISDTRPDIYEVDDGENKNFEPKDRESLKNLGYNVKRSFIDSSIYNQGGLMSYLSDLASREDWYSAMRDLLIQDFGKDKKNLKPKTN
jgi:hypothetical protein